MQIPLTAAALIVIFSAAALVPLKGSAELEADLKSLDLTVRPRLLFGFFRPGIKRRIVLLPDGKLVLLPSGRILKRREKRKRKKRSIIRSLVMTANIKAFRSYLELGIEGEPCASVVLAGALGSVLSAAAAASGAEETECAISPNLESSVFGLDIFVSFSLVPGRILIEAIKSSRRKR